MYVKVTSHTIDNHVDKIIFVESPLVVECSQYYKIHRVKIDNIQLWDRHVHCYTRSIIKYFYNKNILNNGYIKS